MMVPSSRELPFSKGVYSGMRSLETQVRGPGWADVREYLVSCGEGWGGNWVLSIRVTRGNGGRDALWVLCERYGPPGKTGLGRDTRTGHVYPTSDGISMPALMHGLLAEVEQRLQDDKGLAERQASF